MHAADTPYADLTPDLVLDTLEAFGQAVDGRMLQLNSYENRVFQVGVDDGGFVVAKFYRPGRWSDAQILEEHTFTQALADAEVPAVPPLTLTDTHAEGAQLRARHARMQHVADHGDGQVLEARLVAANGVGIQ